jgi:tetratricopeptide (TPR) repeat protein
VAQARGDFALQVVATLYLGQAYLGLGDYRRACECFQSNIQSLDGELTAERFGEAWLPSVLSRVWLIHLLVERGDFIEGIARGEEAVRIAEMVDQPLSRIGAYRGLGYLYLRKGDLDEAIGFLERCRELCQAWNIRAFTPGIVSYLGIAHVLSGRLTDGLPLIEQGIGQGVLIGGGSGHASHLVDLSEAYRLANRIEDAIRSANQALDLARDQNRPSQQARALWALGEVASHRNPPATEEAAASYAAAMTLADELGMRPIVAHCHLGFGKLHGRVGERQEAREHLTTAAAMYREMDMRSWLEKAEAELRLV